MLHRTRFLGSAHGNPENSQPQSELPHVEVSRGEVSRPAQVGRKWHFITTFNHLLGSDFAFITTRSVIWKSCETGAQNITESWREIV